MLPQCNANKRSLPVQTTLFGERIRSAEPKMRAPVYKKRKPVQELHVQTTLTGETVQKPDLRVLGRAEWRMNERSQKRTLAELVGQTVMIF